MIRKDKPIICQACGKDTGYNVKSFSMCVLPREGVSCQKCGFTFLKPKQYELQH